MISTDEEKAAEVPGGERGGGQILCAFVRNFTTPAQLEK